MKFFVGLHQPSDARHFARAFISVNRMRERKKTIGAGEWIMDSGAFTELATYGRYRHSVEHYANVINRWSVDPALVAAVAQDYMCEAWIIQKTGLSLAEHQRLTIERYDALLPLVRGVYVMPVLQGYTGADYVSHVRQYGPRLAHGAYAGVGSVCKRNADPGAIEAVLLAIKRARPDLRLHGFGLKTTALQSDAIRHMLESADSMAWSFAARRQGRNSNDWKEAVAFCKRMDQPPAQLSFCWV
jgi:hypothetical protein